MKKGVQAECSEYEGQEQVGRFQVQVLGDGAEEKKACEPETGTFSLGKDLLPETVKSNRTSWGRNAKSHS